jgi:tetratricopeptide (TPR) repeat protein
VSRSANLPRLVSRALALLLCFGLVAAGLAAEAAPKRPKLKSQKEQAQEQSVTVSKRVGERLKEVIALFEAEKFDEALKMIDELAGRHGLTPPDVANIHRLRGYILNAKGNNEEAVKEFETALDQHAMDPSSQQAMMYAMAAIYTQLGKYDQAIEVIDQWFKAEEAPKADAYYLKAMILVQQEKFAEALEPAKIAIEKSDNPRESWVGLLVAIYTQLQDYNNVAATLEQLIAMSPGKKQYWVQLAAVQNLLERENKALATLQLAREGDLLKEDKELRQLARLLFLREQPLQCAQAVEKGMADGIVKPDADSYRLMSNCYLAARETDRAIEPLAKAGELSPDGTSYMLLGQIYLQRENYEPALEALRKALAKTKPEERGSVQLLIGVAYLGTDQFDAAERAFRDASAEKKVHDAAESYLKFLGQQRARKEAEQALKTAAAGG